MKGKEKETRGKDQSQGKHLLCVLLFKNPSFTITYICG
jgi:hypothetical protein